MDNLPCSTYGSVRVIYDAALIDARTGEPVEATVTHESDAGEDILIVAFGSAALRPGTGDALAHVLRAHAGAPAAEGGGPR